MARLEFSTRVLPDALSLCGFVSFVVSNERITIPKPAPRLSDVNRRRDRGHKYKVRFKPTINEVSYYKVVYLSRGPPGAVMVKTGARLPVHVIAAAGLPLARF